MIRINSLSDLLIEELADLLNAEIQLVEKLPKVANGTQSRAFKVALEDCLEITKDHARRLEAIFNNMGQHPTKVTYKGVKGLIREMENVLLRHEKIPESDAALINVIQRVQQFKIARYKLAREHAVELGQTKIMESLINSLNEERALNFHFNELGQGLINHEAIDPKSLQSKPKENPPASSKGFYVPEGRLRAGGLKKKSKNTDISRFISEGNPNTQEQ